MHPHSCHGLTCSTETRILLKCPLVSLTTSFSRSRLNSAEQQWEGRHCRCTTRWASQTQHNLVHGVQDLYTHARRRVEPHLSCMPPGWQPPPAQDRQMDRQTHTHEHRATLRLAPDVSHTCHHLRVCTGMVLRNQSSACNPQASSQSSQQQQPLPSTPPTPSLHARYLIGGCAQGLNQHLLISPCTLQ